MIIAIIVLVIIVVLVILAVVGFNKLRQADVSAQEALGGIDVQLTRRADLVPNLVETVKGYAKHESQTLEAVIAARRHRRTSCSCRGSWPTPRTNSRSPASTTTMRLPSSTR